MIRPFLKSLLIVFLLFAGLDSLSQTRQIRIKEIGTPFINTYLNSDIGTHDQNSVVTQSADGMLYFGNVSGIIEFDGQNWRVIAVADDAVRDLEAGPDNRIYALTRADFGYIHPNDQGEFVFRSLKEKAPASFNADGSLIRVDVLDGKVAFKTSTELLLYDIEKDTTEVVTAKSRFGIGERVRDEYYIYSEFEGLLQLKGDRLVPVPGAELLEELGVGRVLAYGEDELLILTDDKDLYRFDYKKLTFLPTEISAFLKSADIYSSLSIYGQYFAFGTQRKGIVIINGSGKLVQKIDKSSGLHDGLVDGLMVDDNDDLWAAQLGAISHIVLNSPLTNIDSRHGLGGYVTNLARHNGAIYIATMNGVYYKKDNTPWQKTEVHQPIQQIPGQSEVSWKFVKAGDDFFITGNQGLVQIDGDRTKTIFSEEYLWAAAVFDNGNKMITGGVAGNLYLSVKENNAWQHKGQIAGFSHQIDFLERAEDGELWMTDSGSGIFKLRLNEAKDSVLSVSSYGPEDGLPEAQRNRVFRHTSGLIFATAKGIYVYNSATDRFEPRLDYNEELGEGYIFRFHEIGNGDFYTSIDPEGKGLLRKTAEGYDFDFSPFNRIASHNSEHVSGLGGNDVWIGSTGIKHFEVDFSKKLDQEFKAHIRSVKLSTKLDSVLFGGAGMQNFIELSPSENALYFNYAATFYDELGKMEFQSYLEGTEDTWSAWSTKADRNYTNLSHGTYTFKVRARNVYGQVSEPDAFIFTITTPWYLTIWAFILYLLLLVLLVVAIVKFYIRKLEKDKVRLEQIVEERTKRIREQKESAEKDRELIQQQADRLKALDKVKSRFFANISHELRTPLTLINAPLESLLEQGLIEDKRVQQTLETARRNGVSLLSLVEEILDLAKLDAGKLELVENPVRLYDCLVDTIAAYTSGFEKNQIEFDFDYQESKRLTLLMDEKKFKKVLNNLLSNALKFTTQGGEVSLSVGRSTIDQNSIALHVSDTGRGIHAEDLPFIFDRYYQSELPGKKAEGGTGIGLALARELATLLGGSLLAVSEMGKGSTFTFELPLKEVNAKEVVSTERPMGEVLMRALDKTIADYSQKFEVEKPVLLITEDHPEMRAFIASTLKPYFEIKEAENGKVALNVLNSTNIDIVISDVMMPEMDGFELLKAIKANESLRQVSVVMLTARADQEGKLEALTLGIDDYLTKPFSAAEFLARIKNILENRIKVIRELKQLNGVVELEAQVNLQAWIEEFGLSEREVDVMKLLAKRYTNSEIADKLCVSLNTVKFHLKNLYLKLGISSRTEALSLIEDLPTK